MQRHRRTTLNIICGLMCFSAHVAFGGNDVGNGGFAAVCREQASEHITTAEFYDLWLARNELGLTVRRSRDPIEQQALAAVKRLLDADPEFFSDLPRELHQVITARRVLSPEVKVDWPSDFSTNLNIESTRPDWICEHEPMAVYTDTNQVLLDHEIWTFFESGDVTNPAGHETDQAALYVHEALGKMLRTKLKDQGETRTSLTRKAVVLNALAFSTMPVTGLMKRYEELRDGKSAAPKDTRIEDYIYGEPAATEADTIASWRVACQQWEKDVERELQGVTAYAVPTCGEMVVGKLMNGYWQAGSRGFVMTLAPGNVYELDETIWTPVTPYNGDMVQLHAITNFAAACQEWKTALRARFGAALLFASCGERVDDLVRRLTGYQWYGAPSSGMWKVPQYEKLGFESKGAARAYLLSDGPTETFSGEDYVVRGLKYPHNGVPGYAIGAYQGALDSYLATCRAWKQKVPAGSYAVCSHTPEGVSNSAAGQPAFQMYSWGRLYRF